MVYTLLSYLLPISGLIIIGAVTMSNNPHRWVNRLFFWLSITIALWLMALGIGDVANNPTVSLWAVRSATFVGSLIAPLLLYLANVFPTKLHKPSWALHVFALLPTALFLCTALTPYLVPAIQLEHHSAQPTKLGLLYTLQGLYLAASFVVSFVIMLRKLKVVGTRERSQIRLVIAGLIIALLVNVTTGLLLTDLAQANSYSNLAGSLSFLAFVGATSYAIIKYRLFDIRLAITRFIGYTLTLTLTALVYSFFILLLGTAFSSTNPVSGNQLAILLIPTMVVALTFHRIERFIGRRTQRIFYQQAYDIRDTLDKLSDALLTENDIEHIMHQSLDVLVQALRPTSAYLAVLNASGIVYNHVSVRRDSTPAVGDVLAHLLHERRSLIDREENPNTELAKIMAKDDVSLVLRLGSQRTPIGLLLLGNKQTGTMYTRQDISLLSIGAKNLSVALDNAKKYEQILNFADTMHNEVRRATSRLREANKELKTLDTLKDDFIATASHQLRTPAASVHDALHMLNHPSLTTTDRKDILHMAEASSEHLVMVVRTMLNLARLQAGHFTIDRSKVELCDLANLVIDQVRPLASQKGTAVHLIKPDHPIVVDADSAKINEALSNYIENAIKYSPAQSAITVTLTDNDGKVDFEVRDEGIGVPAEERQHLFRQFYRASNARKEEPDGNGIGLYVVKSIAEGHGGQAYYRPAEKRGSVFGFWFPTKIAASA